MLISDTWLDFFITGDHMVGNVQLLVLVEGNHIMHPTVFLLPWMPLMESQDNGDMSDQHGKGKKVLIEAL